MADNYQTNTGAGGPTFASDDIGGVQHPRAKIEWGEDGSATDSSLSAPLPVQSSLETGRVMAFGISAAPKFALISASASGDNSIIALVAGKKIRVLGYTLVVSGAITAAFRSGTNPLTGGMSFAANGGAAVAISPLGQFETSSSAVLNLYLSSAMPVAGHVTYIEVT